MWYPVMYILFEIDCNLICLYAKIVFTDIDLESVIYLMVFSLYFLISVQYTSILLIIDSTLRSEFFLLYKGML